MMWLINTTTLALEDVVNPDDHTYAILSHTWERDEVTFYDIGHLEQARRKQGFSKIEQTCWLAHGRGIEYAWVDTCCIDKSSSAELTEAINSMFQWYKNAEICFAFLSDLSSDDKNGLQDYFSRCRWFTRGWTLQELIASKEVEFYDQAWNLIGTKLSLQAQLFEITGIDTQILENSDMLPTIPVARRMSWAASRRTTRVEDLAYCLFGIFDVNLPLIYGEGYRAFIRLQEVIAQENNDLSLFAWMSQTDDQEFRGILAHSPAEFKSCGSLQIVADPTVPKVDFSMTNRGFRIIARLTEFETTSLDLECIDSGAPQFHGERGSILLRLVKTAHGYVRYESHIRHTASPFLEPSTSRVASVDIPKAISSAQSCSIKARLLHRFAFQLQNTSGLLCKIRESPPHLWDLVTKSFITDGYKAFTGILQIDLEGRNLQTFCPHHQKREKFRHKSSFIAVFGLESDKDILPNENVEETRPLTPWAGICGYDEANETSRALSEALSLVDKLGYPFVLRRAREISHSQTSGHRMLPEAYDLTPLWYCGGMHQDTFPKRGPSIQVGVSTGLKNSDVGMYELVLNIRRTL
jgi:hypothetical protein